VLVDVRPAADYDKAHPEGAVNVQLFQRTNFAKPSFASYLRAAALMANGVTPVRPFIPAPRLASHWSHCFTELRVRARQNVCHCLYAKKQTDKADSVPAPSAPSGLHARRAEAAGCAAQIEQNPDFVTELAAAGGGGAPGVILACEAGGVLDPSSSFPFGKESRSLKVRCALRVSWRRLLRALRPGCACAAVRSCALRSCRSAFVRTAFVPQSVRECTCSLASSRPAPPVLQAAFKAVRSGQVKEVLHLQGGVYGGLPRQTFSVLLAFARAHAVSQAVYAACVHDVQLSSPSMLQDMSSSALLAV